MVLGRAEIALELAFFPFPIELGRIPSEIPSVATIGENFQELGGLEITQDPSPQITPWEVRSSNSDRPDRAFLKADRRRKWPK